MTANELADLLIIVDALQGNVVLKESATMLRQQAEEIEALKLRELSDEEIIDLCVKQVEKLISPTEPDYDPSQWNDAIERAILKILNVKTILKQYRELKKASEK